MSVGNPNEILGTEHNSPVVATPAHGSTGLEDKLTADVSDKPSNLLQLTEESTPKKEFLQAAQLILDKCGHLEGDTQVYQNYTYTFQKQEDTLTAYKNGHEILKQEGNQAVVDRVTASDIKILSMVTQNLKELEQQTQDFAKASQMILEKRGYSENGTQVFRGNTYTFEKDGDTLTVQKYNQEIFKQVGAQIVSNQVTAQDVGVLISIAQVLEQKKRMSL